MCWYLALLVPDTADAARVTALGARHGFSPGDDLPQGVPRRIAGARLLDPSGSRCDCRTAVGALHRDATPAGALERESRRGRRATWSDARRRRWIAQRLRGIEHRTEGLHPGADDELARWCALAHDAAADPQLGRVGLVRHWLGGGTDDWPAPSIVAATPGALRHVPIETPVWLAPPLP